MGVYKNQKNNTWFFKSTYTDFTGKIHYVTRRGFRTKGEAKKAEANFIIKRKDLLTSSNNIRFGELYREYYNYQSFRVKESTLITNDNKIQLHIIPYFNNKKITDISVRDVQKWQEHMLEKEYSLGYLQNIHTRFSAVMQYAVKQGYLKSNVVHQAGTFVCRSINKKEMEYFTYEEWLNFESVLDNDVYKLLFEFLYYTGARIGELLSLNFNDFDNEFTKFVINKTITSKTKDVGVKITSTKTAESNRTVYLPDILTEKINKYYQKCLTLEGFSKSDFVFGIVKPLSTTTIERKKNKACEKAGVKKIRIHDFRHSHASFLINNGVPPLAISKRLGHKSLATTLNVYVHMFESQNQVAVNKINEVIKDGSN